MSDLSVKKVCNKIWDIEEKYDLFNKKINDVYFWKLVRFSVFKKILKESEVYKNNSKKYSFIDKLKYLFKTIKWHHNYGAIKSKDQKDILIFESPRKKLIDGEYIDIYTNYLINNFKNNDYELIESNYRGTHYSEPSDIRSYNDYFSLFNFLKYQILKIPLNNREKKIIKKIKGEIENFFDVSLNNFEDIIKKYIGRFYYQYKYYNKLLKLKKPKIVYLVCSYGKEALIAACRKNNIKSIEIQHGTINKYHLGYSFPNNDNIPYFPDQINMFGEYWYESTSIPLKKSNIKIVGYPFMENRIKNFQNVKQVNNKILFISQPTITDKIAKIAYKFALNNNDYKVIYKLHPAEYKNWKEKYSLLYKGQKLNNFKVIDTDEKDLYELFYESEYLIGVYSTAVYEGLAMNCKTILINLPGIEYMEYLIDNNLVKLADNYNELACHILNYSFCKTNKNIFFKNVN